MNILPKAKTENVAIQNLKDEVLIYDLSTNLAVCLNMTSANVFNACDGKTSFNELKSQYGYTEDLIYLALDKLKDQNLLEGDYVSPFTGINRREVIRKVGLSSMIALPVISSLVAPSAAHAASGNTCPVGACVTAGQNLCAGCEGRLVTYQSYIAGNNCTVIGRGSPTTLNCALLISANDLMGDSKRIAVN